MIAEPFGAQRESNGVWLHQGKLIVRSDLELYPPIQPPGQSATLVLPDGSITTPMIQPGACQGLLGSYLQSISWTLSTTNVWTETPVQVNATFTGGLLCRFEFTVCLSCPTKGGRVYWTLMQNGTPETNLGVTDAPDANYVFTATGVYYATPVAGLKRIGFAVYAPANTVISNAIASALYVTEQRR